MNKIKVIYDAARKIRNSEVLKGALKVEALRDQDRLLDHSCSFEKNSRDFRIKGKTIVDADCDGKKIKLENIIDLQKEGCREHHHFCHGAHAACIKGGPGRITTILGILSSIRLEEKEDGSAVLSLDSSDMPEDLKSDLCDMMKQCHEHHKPEEGCEEHHMCLKELHDLDTADLSLKVFINGNRQLEKITVDLKGEKKGTDAARHQMKLAAELCLEW